MVSFPHGDGRNGCRSGALLRLVQQRIRGVDHVTDLMRQRVCKHPLLAGEFPGECDVCRRLPRDPDNTPIPLGPIAACGQAAGVRLPPGRIGVAARQHTCLNGLEKHVDGCRVVDVVPAVV
jgi:hypothetical protein